MTKLEKIKQLRSITKEIDKLWIEIDLAENHDNQESYVTGLYEQIEDMTREYKELESSLKSE